MPCDAGRVMISPSGAHGSECAKRLLMLEINRIDRYGFFSRPKEGVVGDMRIEYQ